MTLEQHIFTGWDASVRCDVGAPHVTPIPIPHTVPSPQGNYQALFYWDTYFTNLGLLRSGRVDLARSNCEALMWCLVRRGFVPNSAFVGDDNRSQPPMLAAMVSDVFTVTRDLAWLRAALPRLEREYGFWIEQRTFANGLAHFFHQADEEYLLRFYDRTLHHRLGLDLNASKPEKLEIASQRLAEAESGLDFTPVYDGRAGDYADVKLNTLLWIYETSLARFHQLAGAPDAKIAWWAAQGELRARSVRSLLWDEVTGIFRSRNVRTGTLAPLAHLETYYPLWAGLATPDQAARVRANLPRFENEFGLAQTEPFAGPGYQWGFPNGWPPSHWIAARGLDRYGYHDDARRIAQKYCATQRALFAQSGHMWEKFDTTTGQPGGGEYSADPMLGWTAGVFLALDELARG